MTENIQNGCGMLNPLIKSITETQSTEEHRVTWSWFECLLLIGRQRFTENNDTALVSLKNRPAITLVQT